MSKMRCAGNNQSSYIFNGTLVLEDKLVPSGSILIQEGKITAIGKDIAVQDLESFQYIDAGGDYIAPGFIDIHVHGGGGGDYMDGDAEAVRVANRSHARHGTTTIFPTTTTGSTQQIQQMLLSCQEVKATWSAKDGAFIGGVHFYGPYFAEDKVGCHDPSGRRDPDPQEYEEAFASGIVSVATCAAELPGAEAFCRSAASRGMLVTCGHSNATWEEMQRVFDQGMRHVDHFWCAMSSVTSLRPKHGFPMRAGMEQFVLARKEMSTEVIADGCHLSPELLSFAYEMLGPARLCLVTDSSRALDMPPGEYRFGSRDDGPCFLSDGEKGFQPDHGLASSVRGMDFMVGHMAAVTKATLPEIIQMASLTPARLVGKDAEMGSLAVGKRGDVVLLDRNSLKAKIVFLQGECFDD